MSPWLGLHEKGSDAKTAVEAFKAYIRTRNSCDAPLFFQKDWPVLTQNELGHPFELVLRFASGYRDLTASDNRRAETTLPDNGTWLLDLLVSALWSHLNYWGRQDQPLNVQCDVGKPLQPSIAAFRGDETDPAVVRARQMGREKPLGWIVGRLIEFVDSKCLTSAPLGPSLTWASSYLIEGRAPRALKPQGSFSASPEGVVDLDGSVWEWTMECYDGPDGGTSPDRCPAFFVGGEHLAAMSYLVRDPACGGCAVGTLPAHLGMRLISDKAV